MQVYDIKVVDSETHCELYAQVECDTDWVLWHKPFPLWYRFPRQYKEFLNPENGDTFVAAFFVPAMVLGEPLEIHAPVSAKLLKSVSNVQNIYRCWNKRFSRVGIQAPIRQPDLPNVERKSNIGLFFSMGVNSLYSLLKNVDAYPEGDKAITHLINVWGFDVHLWQDNLHSTILANICKIAEALGKEEMQVTTNLREFSDKILDWASLYCGSAMASVALALGCMFKEAYISTGQTYSWLGQNGSHPLVDPLWGNESLSFIHDGLELGRLAKIEFIARLPLLVENLRVCATNRLAGEYNCGKCEKCLGAMLGLHVANALVRCETLPHNIDVGLIQQLRSPSSTGLNLFRGVIGKLDSSDEDLAIKVALEECINRIR